MGTFISYLAHTGNAVVHIDNILNEKIADYSKNKHFINSIDSINATEINYLTLEGVGKYLAGAWPFSYLIDNDSFVNKLLKLFYNNMYCNGIEELLLMVDYYNSCNENWNNENKKRWIVSKESINRLPLKLPEFKSPFLNFEIISTLEQLDKAMKYCKRSTTLQNNKKIIFNFKLNTFNDITIITTNIYNNNNDNNYHNNKTINYKNSTIVNSVDQITFKKEEFNKEPNRIYFYTYNLVFYIEFLNDKKGFEIVYYNYNNYNFEQTFRTNHFIELANKLCKEIDFDYLNVQVYKTSCCNLN
ncbi:hypothetical protein ABK040_001397 [Willaertia magna]